MTILAPGQALDLLDRALGYTRGCLATAHGTALSRPTPCAAWDLRALLEHLDDSLAALTEAAVGGHVGLTTAPGPIVALPAFRLPAGASLAAAVGCRASAAVGAWTTYVGRAAISLGPDAELADHVVAAVGALEVTVHGWDVARACGSDRPMPERLAADLLGVARWSVTDEDRPARFGPALAPVTDAPADVLLAFVGRMP